MFAPPVLETYSCRDLAEVLALTDEWAIKAKALSSDDVLRVAHSIDNETAPALGAGCFPFRFKPALRWGKANGIATSCIHVFRQVAAANVVAGLWAGLKRANDPLQQEDVQRLSRIRCLCRLATAHGDISEGLRPAALATANLAEALLLFRMATCVENPSAAMAGTAFRTLLCVWRMLEREPGQPRLKEKVIARACSGYVALVCAHHHLPGTDKWREGDVATTAARVRDAWAVATGPEREAPALKALNGTYGVCGNAAALATLAAAVRAGVAPSYAGDTLSLPPPSTNVENIVCQKKGLFMFQRRDGGAPCFSFDGLTVPLRDLPRATPPAKPAVAPTPVPKKGRVVVPSRGSLL